MISHDTIRSAIFTTLKADSSTNTTIKKWYRLVIPKVVIYPAVAVMDILQPLTGELGATTLETTMTDPMVIRTLVLTENYNVDDTDSDLGDAYIYVFNALLATPDLGLTDFDVLNMQLNTKPFPEYGTNTMGAEILLTAVAGAT